MPAMGVAAQVIKMRTAATDLETVGGKEAIAAVVATRKVEHRRPNHQKMERRGA